MEEMNILSSMNINSTEALNWLERSIKNTICLNDRMTQKEREQDKLHLAVDVYMAHAKVQSMLDTFDVADRHKADMLMHHAWTEEALKLAESPAAAAFHTRVLSSAYLRITAERLENEQRKKKKEFDKLLYSLK